MTDPSDEPEKTEKLPRLFDAAPEPDADADAAPGNDPGDTAVLPRMFDDEPESTAVLPRMFDEAPAPSSAPSPPEDVTARMLPIFADPPAPAQLDAAAARDADELPTALDDAIVWSVLETHLDEAEYLLDLREACLAAPEWTLGELEEGPETRLRAHLDGLVLGEGPVGTQLLEPILADPSQSPGRIVAAALARLEIDARGPEHLLAAIDASEPEQVEHHHALTRALALADHTELPALVLETLDAAPPHGRVARLELLARLRVSIGPKLAALLRVDDLATLRAAASLARVALDHATVAALAPRAQSEDPQLRALTLDAALLHGVPGAWPNVLHAAFIAPDPALRRWAFERIALLGDAAAHQRLLAALAEPAARADALWALGFCGRPAAVDAAIPWLADEALGPLAGEVVCAIAGLPREGDEWWQERPTPSDDDALPPLADDDLDAELEPPPEAGLPLPNPTTITAWWAEQNQQFDPAQRYLDGQPRSLAGLLAALREGPLRRRHVLALELSLRSGGRAHVDTHAWASVQRRQLEGVEGVVVDLRASLPG